MTPSNPPPDRDARPPGRTVSRTLAFFRHLVDNPTLLGLCRECNTHAEISGSLRLDRGQLSKVLSGRLPIGPAMVARATLFLPTDESCRLIECYLADELDQIEAARSRYAERFAKPWDGGFTMTLLVRKG